MSLQAFVWVYKLQGCTDPQARLVLYGMAEHAAADGTRCFPSLTTLMRATSLSERTIRAKLRWLQENGFIDEGDEAVTAVLFPRADRRPRTYNLKMDEGQTSPVVDTGGKSRPDGGQITSLRGATAAPKPVLNQEQNLKSPPNPPKGGGLSVTTAPGKEAYSAAFEAIWQIYPRSKGGSKWDAWKRWERMGIGKWGADQRAMIAGDLVTRAKQDRQWLGGFVPHLSTYLNARGWTAPIDTTRDTAGAGHESKHDAAQRRNAEHAERLRAEHAATGATSLEYGDHDPL